MSIQLRVAVIFLITLIFAGSALFGLVQIAKGARYHQINSLHLRYVVQLKDALVERPDELIQNHLYVEIIRNIRRQMEGCLAQINALERYIMRTIGTDMIITLCQNDIALADGILELGEGYEIGEFSLQDMKDFLYDTSIQFTENSVHLEEYITETVRFYITTILWLLAGLSIIVFAFLITILISISRLFREMDKINDALAKSNEENQRLANLDILTGLPNRYMFNNTLDRIISYSKRHKQLFALMFIDLDKFKQINDTHGHEAGDRCLIEVAQRLSDTLRGSDFVARIGGDEFVALVQSLKKRSDANLVADKIVQIVSDPIIVDGLVLKVGVSIGITIYPDDGEDASSLMRNSDQAMYQAKQSESNKYTTYKESDG